MPVVPMRRAPPEAPPVDLPPENYLLMAAATMHEMGRLIPQGGQKEMKDFVEGQRDLPENSPGNTNQRGWEPINPGEDSVDELGHRGERDDKLGFHWTKKV